MNKNEEITRIILNHSPAAQAIYLYGSYGTAGEWPDSDVDIALLLPPVEAKTAGDALKGSHTLYCQSNLS